MKYDDEVRQRRQDADTLRKLADNIRAMPAYERRDTFRAMASRLTHPEPDTKVRLTTVLDRILSTFDGKLSVWEVSYVSSTPGRNLVDRVHLHLERRHEPAPDGSTVSRIDVYFFAIDGFVNALSPVDWTIWTSGSERTGTDPNLGSAIVSCYNVTNWPNGGISRR